MDPIQTSIMANRFNAIVEEASSTLQRTAHTTFVKLVQDFQCALANVDGEVFAYPGKTGVSAFIGLSVKGGLGAIPLDSLRPGDCIITNDPFSSDGMVTHLMDVSLVRPIFRDGKLIALSWAFVHASDIGGAVPGSIAPMLTETFQEGLRLRPTFLYRDNRVVEAVRDILTDNSRISSELWGDVTAMYAAMKNMDLRLNQLCDRYGRDVVVRGMEATLAFAETRARGVIAAIPDGEYTFSDFIEGMNADENIYIHARMTVSGSDLVFDFTGTDPQVAAAFNYVTGSTTNPYSLQSLIYYLLTRAPDAPRNRGLLRPVRIIAPRGTIMNAEYPAAGGSRVTTSTRVYDVVLGCLNAAIPGGVSGAGPGMAGIIVVNGRNRLHGGRRVSVINPIVGGSGGLSGQDGVDGVDHRSGALLTVPAETIEIETVIRVRRYGLAPDSHGAGRWRSGAALVMELENTDHEATMTVRGIDRFRFRPWGIEGGHPGSTCRVTLNPGTDRETEIGKINVLHLRKGDVVRLVTPAGGGYGDPALRDPDLVARDVALGLVSPERARADYAVVVAPDGRPDAGATAVLRAGRPAAPRRIAFCDRRNAFDDLWPADTRAALARLTLERDVPNRSELLRRTAAEITAAGRPATLDAIATTITRQHKLLAE